MEKNNYVDEATREPSYIGLHLELTVHHPRVAPRLLSLQSAPKD